jgi:hypothetical protein
LVYSTTIVAGRFGWEFATASPRNEANCDITLSS